MLQEPTDAIVRPVSRAMQAGLRLGLIDPVVGSICGPVPFQGPLVTELSDRPAL